MKRLITIVTLCVAIAALVAAGPVIFMSLPDLFGPGWNLRAVLFSVALVLGGLGVVGFCAVTLLAMRDSLKLLRAIRDSNRRLFKSLASFQGRLSAPVRVASGPSCEVKQLVLPRMNEMFAALQETSERQMEVRQSIATTILEKVLQTSELVGTLRCRAPEEQRASSEQVSRVHCGREAPDQEPGSPSGPQNAEGTIGKSAPSMIEYSQLEGLLAIYGTLPLRAPLAPLRGWSVSPDCGAYLVSLTLSQRPKLVVEFGSGASTVLLAAALEKLGEGRLISLEHEMSYLEDTRRELEKQGLEDRVTIVHSPLTEVRLGDSTWSWYDPRALAGLSDIDLLFVDGPPNAVHELARYPALPMLVDRLSPGAVIVLDDAARHGELEVLDRWKTEFTSFSCRYIAHEKGTAQLSRAA